MLTSKDQELAVLLSALSLACKATARACNKAGIALLFGLAGVCFLFGQVTWLFALSFPLSCNRPGHLTGVLPEFGSNKPKR